LLTAERHRKILEELKEHRIVHSSELMEQFHVSKETIRRDLNLLEEQGLLRKVYGGAVLDRVDPSFSPFQDRIVRNPLQKEEIALLAARYVKESMSIAMDVSTTNLAIARHLKKTFRHLTILTNSLAIASELMDAEDFTVILTGGTLHRKEMAVNGDICRENISRFHVDLYFLSCNGVSLTSGITDFGVDEVSTKRAILRHAKRVILVCTSDRFDVTSLLSVCDLHLPDCIITDSQLSGHVRAVYESNHVRIVNS